MNKKDLENKIEEYKKAINKTKSEYLKRDYIKAIKKLERKLKDERIYLCR